jgi:[acyl-carrier-protein] S-malonyltransferase
LAALDVLDARSPAVVAGCQAAAGLSLGEYTALVFAGVLDFESGLRLVQARGAAMQEAADATPSGMVSLLGLDRDKVEALCKDTAEGETLQIANLLSPGNIAVSGTKAACRRVAERAEAAGATKAVPLAVAGAFHTPIMQSAVAKLSAALAGIPLKAPRIPVVSNVDARSHDDPEEIRELLPKQIVSPVLWEQSVRGLLAEGFDEFYEVGPGRVLRGLMKRIDRKAVAKGIDEG